MKYALILFLIPTPADAARDHLAQRDRQVVATGVTHADKGLSGLDKAGLAVMAGCAAFDAATARRDLALGIRIGAGALIGGLVLAKLAPGWLSWPMASASCGDAGNNARAGKGE